MYLKDINLFHMWCDWLLGVCMVSLDSWLSVGMLSSRELSNKTINY
jgi:hypothetical protein